MLEVFDRYEAEYQKACKESDDKYERLKSLIQSEKESFELCVKSTQTLRDFKKGLDMDEYKRWSREEQMLSIKNYLTQPCFRGEASFHWRAIEDFYEDEGFTLEDDEELMGMLNEDIYYIWGLIDLALHLRKEDEI